MFPVLGFFWLSYCAMLASESIREVGESTFTAVPVSAP